MDLQTERRRLSFDANTGDTKALKELEKLNARSATAGLEIENIRSAIDEAKRRLSAAIRDEETAKAREDAEAALVIAERLVERGAKIDSALREASEQLAAYKTDVDMLGQLGCVAPSGQQFRVYCAAAVTTFVMTLPFRVERGFLSPAERRSFASLSANWRDGVVRWASRFLVKEAA